MKSLKWYAPAVPVEGREGAGERWPALAGREGPKRTYKDQIQLRVTKMNHKALMAKEKLV